MAVFTSKQVTIGTTIGVTYNADGTQNIIIKDNGKFVEVPPVLLWTNSNPSSVFAEQTVSVDGAEYDSYLVEVRGYYNDAGTAFGVTLVPKDGNSHSLSSTMANSLSFGIRRVIANGNNIEFSNGYTLSINSSSGATNGSSNNGGAIPTRIWGVKYVV